MLRRSLLQFFRITEREPLAAANKGRHRNKPPTPRAGLKFMDDHRRTQEQRKTQQKQQRFLGQANRGPTGTARLSAEGDQSDRYSAQRSFEGRWRGLVDENTRHSSFQDSAFASSRPSQGGGRGNNDPAAAVEQHARFQLGRDDAIAAQADMQRADITGLRGIRSPKHYDSQPQYGEVPKSQQQKRSGAGGGGEQQESRRDKIKRMRNVMIADKKMSSFEITDGAEDDDELAEINKMSGHHVAVSGRSALAQNVLLRNSLSSRRNLSSWDAIDTESEFQKELLDEVAARSDDGQWQSSEGHYRHTFDSSTNLEHQRDAVQHSKSIYSNRDIPIPDMSAFHSFITPLEEKEIVQELSKLLLKPVAAFHGEEGRYCVNLFERRLGSAAASSTSASSIASKLNWGSNAIDDGKEEEDEQKSTDALVYSISQDAPALHRVLERAVQTDRIPSMPNVVQVSEMVSAYAGYPPHRKHSSIGSYFGVLNLVSSAQMDFLHVDQPWAPKLLLLPRALYVFGPEVISQFKPGYCHLEREYATHQGRSRMSKDYRIEVMFATVDAETVPRLQVPLSMTEYAEQKAAAGRKKEGEE